MLALPENLPRVRPASIEQAMSDIYPTLSTVGKYFSKEAAQDTVAEIIAQAAAMVNVGKNLQPHQIEFLADDILMDWHWLTIGEIRFVMEQGVRGKYGVLYDRVDANMVLEWLGKYDETRTDIVERRSQRAHLDSPPIPVSENAVEMPESARQSVGKLENTFLVDGEAKRGIVSGDFEPDEHVLRMIEMEWADLPDDTRPPYENYKALRLALLKAQMKR